MRRSLSALRSFIIARQSVRQKRFLRESRPGCRGKEQRRHRTADKTLRCKVECFTQAFLRKPEGEVLKKLAQREKSTIVVGRISISRCATSRSAKRVGSAFAVYPATLLYCGTLPTVRQTVALPVAFYYSLLPIYVNSIRSYMELLSQGILARSEVRITLIG